MNDSGTQEGDLTTIGHDPAAFEIFYRAHIDIVGRFVARRVDDPHTAADLTAEVFLAVIHSAAGYRADRGSPLGWLFGVARNVIAAERRRSLRQHQASGRVAGRRLLDPDDIARIEERIDAEAVARRTYEALGGLPEQTRALLELVAVDGLSVAEAAQALGISPIAARVRLHRARRTVRLLLAHPDPAFS
ncbi:RNA polymerase sigma factor [Micromonospora sp. NBC_01796]|uniref:RNA polymerase sigma factor n=1 Tax=Micromonospora sp. NBC_01796 TaxID=2975987 RepID=UPI002DDA28F6|nr:sigma-70 family RNA polymerase sigma factor [Micromonospora sp. NBC_01796]WSA86980.1 sigma-70 family RNA polymerase sigma factor [Micromonospora sp. NBC_01796]